MRMKNTDMLSGSITKGLIAMSIPIMVVNITASLFNMFDMVVLRMFANESAVGAVGACGMLITVCIALFSGTAVGANIVVAKRIGAGDRTQTEKAVTTALLFSVVGSLLLLIVGVTCGETFLKWTNCPGELLPQAVAYFKTYFYGLPFYIVYAFCAAILRAMGDTKRPMYFMLAGGLLKAGLTTLFVAGFDLGVEGVAFATDITHFFEACLAFGVVYKVKEHFCIAFKKLRFDASALKEILQVGIPTGLSTALFSFLSLLMSSAVNRFGEAATTGVAIATQFDSILYHICTAPAAVIAPYIAQNMGAHQMKRVKQTVIRGMMVTAAFGVFFGVVLMVLSKPLVIAMSDSEMVIQFAMQRLVVTASAYFICGIQDALSGVFRGLGKPNIPTLILLLCEYPLRLIWIFVLFPRVPNVTFLYAVCPVDWVLTGTIQFVLYLMFLRRPNSILNCANENPCSSAC